MGEEELARRARDIVWLLSDVDGVLTDGRLYYGESGEALKVFHVKDGLAVHRARQAGMHVGLLTARSSRALEARARELEIDEVMSGRGDKRAAFADFLARQQVSANAVAYIGDDLPDLPVLEQVGIAFAPCDAVAEVRSSADRVLGCAGGAGALREAVEILLRRRSG